MAAKRDRSPDEAGVSLVLRALVVRAGGRSCCRNRSALAVRLQLLGVVLLRRASCCGRRCCVRCLCESLNGDQRDRCGCERDDNFFHVLFPKPKRLSHVNEISCTVKQARLERPSRSPRESITQRRRFVMRKTRYVFSGRQLAFVGLSIIQYPVPGTLPTRYQTRLRSRLAVSCKVGKTRCSAAFADSSPIAMLTLIAATTKPCRSRNGTATPRTPSSSC